jgi:hypothetical protein
MQFIKLIVGQIAYLICVSVFVAIISVVLKKDTNIVFDKVRWLINNSIGALLTFFALATILNYFGYFK